MLPVGSLEAWAWGSRVGPPVDAAARPALTAHMARSQAWAAVGSAGTGLDGFLQTHRQAYRAAADRATRYLRETVPAYLECHRGPSAATRLPFVARNTVTYRVRRADALLGRSLAERAIELQAALLLARAVGGQDPTPGDAGRPRRPVAQATDE